MPAWSECRHNSANNMHALDALPYLAISTIDCGWRSERVQALIELDRDEA
jgi:hypothetical protein